MLKFISLITRSLKKKFSSFGPDEIEELRETDTEDCIIIDKEMSWISEPTYMNYNDRRYRHSGMDEILNSINDFNHRRFM